MFNNLNRNKIILLTIAILVALAIPLTIIQVQKQQQIRQRAAPQESQQTQSSPLVSLVLDSKSKGIKIDDTFDVDVYLINSAGTDISAVDITIHYNKELLNIVRLDTPPTQFLPVIKPVLHTPGTIHYVGISFFPGINKPLSSIITSFKIGTLTFQALQEGKAKVTFDNDKIIVTTAGSRHNIFDPKNNKNQIGEYSIGTFTVSGTIYVDSASGRLPLQPFSSGAYMEIAGKNLDKSKTIPISNEGSYSFSDIPPGEYRLLLHMPYGFASTTKTENIKQNDVSRDLGTANIFKDINVNNQDVKDNFYIQTNFPVSEILKPEKYQELYRTFNECYGITLTLDEKKLDPKTLDKCNATDLDKNGVIDSFDYNILLHNAQQK